jgi:quercetin dioxygenase-like cupin family protein
MSAHHMANSIPFTINLGLVLWLAVVPAFAQAQDDPITMLPEDISYKAPVSGAGGSAVLFGDPTKPGVYVLRAKIAAGTKIMPHWHPDEARTLVVLSGTLYHGYGDEWDESKLKPHPVGTFAYEPPKKAHFAWAKDGEVIIHITAVGPTGTTRVERK